MIRLPLKTLNRHVSIPTLQAYTRHNGLSIRFFAKQAKETANPSVKKPNKISSSSSARERLRPVRENMSGSNTIKTFISENWPFGILGGILTGVGYFVYDSYSKDMNPVDRIKHGIDDFFSNVEQYTDPDPEVFRVEYLQMSGNPIAHIPVYAQDGSSGSPIVTVVFSLEGTLLKQMYDRKYGYRYMKRPMIAPLLKGLNQLETSAFFWSTTSIGMTLGDPNSVVYKMLKEEKLLRTAQEMYACAFGKEHMFQEAGKHTIRIAPLPRYKPNILLVDHEQRNYDAQPNNTLLLQKFENDDDDGQVLMDVLAFMHLFRHLFKSKKVKNVEEAMLWLKDRHPEIRTNPYSMGKFIRMETAEVRAREEEMELHSLKSVMHTLHGRSEALAHAKAVTAHSSRYARVPENSMVAQRINKLKQQQERMMKAQQAEMQRGGEASA